LDSRTPDTFDHLFIENHRNISTPSSEFTQLLKTSGWRLNNDHLQLPLLLIRLQEERIAYETEKVLNAKSPRLKDMQRRINRCFSELARRFSAAIAVLTFTLMGAAFGMDISRHHSKKGVFVVIGLAALFLVSFFSAKGLDHTVSVSVPLYLFPHVIIVALSIWTLKRVTKGIE
jgi:lipopolysaccharide export system permease protein